MASRRKKRKHQQEQDPLGGLSLDDLMGLDLLSDPPGPSKSASVATAPFRLALAVVKLPFKLVAGVVKAPFKVVRAILPGGNKNE